MTNSRRTALGLATSIFLAALAYFAVGEALSRPANGPVGPSPAELRARSVIIQSASGQAVSGWYIPGRPRSGAVLLLHGVRSDRRQMIGRAKLLSNLGYSALLIDLPAHGESAGDRITFGVREGEGVKAALDYLRQQRPGEKIGVIGASLGAASLVLAKAAPAPDAVVLESMFPTIEEAVANRLEARLGPAGRYLAPSLLWQLPLRLGLNPNQIQPAVDIAMLNAPVLIASGTADRHTTLAESKRIFEAAHEPKQFWAVEGAGHVDLFAYGPKAYEANVLPFLAKHLRDADQPTPSNQANRP